MTPHQRGVLMARWLWTVDGLIWVKTSNARPVGRAYA